MTEPIPARRAAGLLVRLRFLRVRNRLLARTRKRPPATAVRTATPGKPQQRWMVSLFVAAYFLFISFQQTGRALTVMAAHERALPFRLAADLWSLALIQDASVEAALLMLATLVFSLANRELAATEWDLEWLATLPVGSHTLLAIRILERAVVNPVGFALVWPFATLVAWRCGFGGGAPVLAAIATLLLMVGVATLWTVAETALRLVLAPPRLRNLQALFTVASLAAMFLAMSPVTGNASAVYALARRLPHLALYSPPALAIHALTRLRLATAVSDLALLAAEALLVAAAGVALLSRLLRHGFVATGGRESGVARRARARAVADGAEGPRPWLSPLHRRELRLLARDRTFMVQTLVMPALIIGAQVYFGVRGLHGGGANPAHIAALAFGISAYAIMFSAFQTINGEGHALWILYTFPRRLESLLREKATLWAVISLIYPLVVVGIGLRISGLSLRALGLAAIAVAGVPIFAAIATALGVFAADPLAAEVQRRLRPSYVYLYMTLAGLYTYALYATGVSQRLVLMVLTALVALALWQKARDQLPYLLDPAASPPSRVSVADGLIAALVFFVAQAAVALAYHPTDAVPVGPLLLRIFVWAGAITFALVRLVYWRTRPTGVPRLLGSGVPRALAVGLAGGAVASAVGIAYLLLLRHLGRLPSPPPSHSGTELGVGWLLPLAVVAAPLFEEFIFRGLIFGGLRRTFGLGGAALASAAIFAIVHPPLAALPVFCMGLLAALTYERAGMLLAPMLVHAGYNAAVVLVQLLWLR